MKKYIFLIAFNLIQIFAQDYDPLPILFKLPGDSTKK